MIKNVSVMVMVSFFLLIDTSYVLAEALYHYDSGGPSIQHLKDTLLNEKKEKQFYVIALNHSDPKQIKDQLKILFPTTRISIDLRTRSLTVWATSQAFRRIRHIIRKLDKAVPKIKLSIEVIEVNVIALKRNRHLFSSLVDPVSFTYDVAENLLVPSTKLRAVLQFMIEKGEAKIIAKPEVVSLDNQPSEIDIGDREPYVQTKITQTQVINTINFIDTGIKIKVLPRLSSGNRVTISIDVQMNAIKLYKELDQGRYPVISKRHAKTQVSIAHKQTMVIAGLWNEARHETLLSLPFLSDIPFLGELFKSTSTEFITTDIMFLITPEIIAENDV